MYLHIGNGESIRTEDIIGIFDLDTATISKTTKKYINKKEKEGRVEYLDYDLPRAFILCKKGDDEKIKLSRISTTGLRQRIEMDLLKQE
jgi:hypothetical protein